MKKTNGIIQFEMNQQWNDSMHDTSNIVDVYLIDLLKLLFRLYYFFLDN